MTTQPECDTTTIMSFDMNMLVTSESDLLTWVLRKKTWKFKKIFTMIYGHRYHGQKIVKCLRLSRLFFNEVHLYSYQEDSEFGETDNFQNLLMGIEKGQMRSKHTSFEYSEYIRSTEYHDIFISHTRSPTSRYQLSNIICSDKK